VSDEPEQEGPSAQPLAPTPRLARQIEPPQDLADRSEAVREKLDDLRPWRVRLLYRNARKHKWRFLGGVVVVVLVVVLVWTQSDHPGLLAALIGCAVLLNLAILGVARGVRRFAWLGVAVFLSVPFFGGIVAAVRTHLKPKLQPVALIRKSDNVGICGIYITETDKRVYLGRIEPNGERAAGGTGRIFWVRDDDVDMVKIGAAQPLTDANRRAPMMLRELYADRAEDPGVALKPTTTTEDSTTESDAKKQTVSERAPQPRQAKPKPEPSTVADVCTDVSLGGKSAAGTAPKDDSPGDGGRKRPARSSGSGLDVATWR
jgi:hypothetical protein